MFELKPDLSAEKDNIYKEINDLKTEKINTHSTENQTDEYEQELFDKDYQTMSLEELIQEFRELLQGHKIQFIRKKIHLIRIEFGNKMNISAEKETSEQEKSHILELETQFQKLCELYRKECKAFQEEMNLNLIHREDLINEIQKVVISVKDDSEKNLNQAREKIKQLREQWFNIGAIPKEKHNDLYERFNYYMNVFYDHIRLNNDFMESDFQRNLEEKNKLIALAEELLEENDSLRSSIELKKLHDAWKSIGPVKREYSDDIWTKFKEITQEINKKRKIFIDEQNKKLQKNLEIKQEIISLIEKINAKKTTTHEQWQRNITSVSKLIDLFSKTGRVPHIFDKEIWNAYLKSVKTFSKNKNDFYKKIKKTSQEILERKRELLELAKSHQYSQDWEQTSQLMKQIQKEWLNMDFVPKSEAKKMYKELKEICNYFFEKKNEALKNSEKQEIKSLEQKKKIIVELENYSNFSDKETTISFLNNILKKWDAIESLPHSLSIIDFNFRKILKSSYEKVGISSDSIDILSYKKYLENLKNNEHLKIKEEIFIRKKIDELKSKILNFENNISFFGKDSQNNPMVKDVLKNINKLKESLNIWQIKLEGIRELKQ